MGIETKCSDCGKTFEKDEIYWVKPLKEGKEEYSCMICVSAKSSKGMEECFKKYGKVVYTGLD